ncbi:MAG: hypothetical protein V1790_00110 [Planctomycetota bacterium]
MGTQRWTCLLGVCLCLTAGTELTVAAVGPDAGDEAAASPRGAVAESLDPACDTFGFFDNPWSRSYRYRGNAFHLEFRAVLKEIKMELAFSGTTDLYVAIHRQRPDGCYKLHVPIIDLINVRGVLDPISGLPVPHFYTTGVLDPPVTLEPGFKYAIAFAWGETVITHGYDVQASPFRAGQFLGLVAATLSPPPDPLVPETLCLDPYAGYAYSMQLCFEPQIGACCRASDQRCHEVVESECTGAGDFFHGERTRCADTPCVFGACCFPCGTCGDDYTGDSCLAAGGVVQWSGVSCSPTLCPPVTGACCNGTTCTVKCRPDCVSGGGAYLGDNTDCDPNMCRGACCVAGGCLNRTQAGCATIPGVFKGAGTACLTLPRGSECGGACCRGIDIDTNLGFCEPLAAREDCIVDPEGFPFSAYRGDGTSCGGSCTGTGITYRACCLPDGTCINTTSSICVAAWIAGSYNPDKKCEDVGTTFCASSVGRCCFTDGRCEHLTETGCRALVGCSAAPAPCSNFAGTGTTCSPSVCAGYVPVGACCGTAPGICSVVTENQCLSTNGIYRGNGSNCTLVPQTCPGFGACCHYDGDCFDDFTHAECDTIGGTYEQDASVCSPTLACDQRGACCAITGTCLFITESQCTGIGDGVVFRGIGVGCAANTCPTGACCTTTGCEVLTVPGCTSAGGEFQGVDIACTPSPCISGACCTDRTCTTETEADCVNGGGSFIGEDVPCSADRCLAGACCLSAGCEVRSPSDCASSGGVFAFQGVDDVCEAGLCVFGACCNGETCTSQTRHTCERDGGTYLGDAVACSATVCTLGACCQSETCSQRQELLCPSPGGVFLGRGVACAADTCHIGGCCRGDACHTDIKLLCTRNGGTYLGDGAACGTGVCATGACCTTGQCEAVPSLSCRDRGGTFLGLGTACDAATCTQGACCKFDGCTPDFGLLCTQGNGVFLGPGQACAAEMCHRGGCCQGETCQTAVNFLCTRDGGTFLGLGALCDADSCTPGACCDGIACSRDIRFTCVHAGHVFNGPGTTCDAPNACPCTNNAQCNDRWDCTPNDRCESGVCVNDRHWGPAEWHEMASCLSRSGPSPPVPADCDCYDIDRNRHVDLHDVARFFMNFSGP